MAIAVVKELIQNGESAYQHRDYIKAIDSFKESLSKDPDNLEAHYYLGVIYSKLDDYKNSLYHLEFISSHPYTFIQINHVNTLVAFIYTKLQQYDKALSCIDRVLQNNGNDILSLLTQAYIYFEMGQSKRAINSYQKVIAIDPTNLTALNSIGYIYIETGDNIQYGIDLCEKALAQKPNSAAYLDSIGWGYHKLGNDNKAVDYLRQAFELSPNNQTIKKHLKDLLRA